MHEDPNVHPASVGAISFLKVRILHEKGPNREVSRVSRRSRGGFSEFTIIFLDRHGRLWECMMKWWVAALSGPEKLDDGDLRRSRKTTTITYLMRCRSLVDLPHPQFRVQVRNGGLIVASCPCVFSSGTRPRWLKWQ
ncbi:hypothetical protein EVAR_41413_1 [Eumeta japonica]|uniref:Uncharacterized protein n=1 Tax=Eumeta variegata TaxID=151549 RepID=A0A4C1W589_EUMVA|nr:hypothetical protein EVAR_41413_1 [Eumeta japonica]